MKTETIDVVDFQYLLNLLYIWMGKMTMTYFKKNDDGQDTMKRLNKIWKDKGISILTKMRTVHSPIWQQELDCEK